MNNKTNNPEIVTDLTEAIKNYMTQAESAYQGATALIVTNQEQYDYAGEYIASLKKYKNDLEKDRKELVDPLNAHVKKINAKFKPHATNIDNAIATANQKMTTYFREEERKRLKLEADAAEKSRKEQERLQKRADAAREKGQEEKAEALEQSADLVVPAPVAETATRQTASTTIAKTWSAQIYDKLSLIKAIASGKASMEYVEANMTALNQAARSQKETMNVPGVRSVSKDSVRLK